MDVTNSTVQLNTSDGKMDAYVAQPKDGGSYPGIVVIQEAFGVNDHIKKVTDRIAAEGYVAIAPDIYHRESGAYYSVFRYAESHRDSAAGARSARRWKMSARPSPTSNRKATSKRAPSASSAFAWAAGSPIWTAAHHANDVKVRRALLRRRHSDGQSESAVAHQAK